MFMCVLINLLMKFLLFVFELNDVVVIFGMLPVILGDFVENNRVHFFPFGIHFI